MCCCLQRLRVLCLYSCCRVNANIAVARAVPAASDIGAVVVVAIAMAPNTQERVSVHAAPLTPGLTPSSTPIRMSIL